MCARPPTLWDGCSLFLSSKEKGLKGTACGRWGEEMESLRVGLPSNHPVLTLPWQHSSSIAYVLRPAGSVKCRALGIPRPAVPFEQLAEPREAWRVCTGQRGETQKEMARLLCGQDASPSCQSGWLAYKSVLFPEPAPGEVAMLIFLLHSGSFRPKF